MNDSAPNLFNALFGLHPTERRSQKENFLSEAFAHILQTCDGARDAWLSRALGRRVQATESEVITRPTEQDEGGVIVFPDMRVMGVLDDGQPFDVYSEHKWDSPCSTSQILEYLKIPKRRGDHCSLVFVGASRRQRWQAENCDPRMRGKAFLWEDIFEDFNRLNNPPDILNQFLVFMKTHGLSPGKPIEVPTMLAFLQSRGFESSLEHSANKLNDQFDWDFFPKRYRNDEERKVSNRWGRIAIEFITPAWKPTITVGFLIDETDHGVSFVNRQKGIDLLLRIETAPGEQKNIAPALAELARKREKLSGFAASALLLRERGNGNSHSLLIVRSCLGDIVEKAPTQQEQLEAIHNTLKRWGDTLFGDGTLEKAFKQAGLDSGM